jgi:lipoate-protein ligase B
VIAPAVPEPPLRIAWLGRVGYRRAWELQETLRRAILDGSGAETLLLLEHDPVITLGRSARATHVLVPETTLAARGVELVQSSRGGDVTWHGPGQLVAYPVVRLGRGVLAHVEAMAAAVIDVAASVGVEAAFRRECPGVWVDDRKLCAFGVQVHRRVAIHGLALNVNPALDAFSMIVPCGLSGAGVTSLAALTGRDHTPRSLADALGAALARRLGRVARAVEHAPDLAALAGPPPLAPPAPLTIAPRD